MKEDKTGTKAKIHMATIHNTNNVKELRHQFTLIYRKVLSTLFRINNLIDTHDWLGSL